MSTINNENENFNHSNSMLSHVEITKTAQFACTAHALTTSVEEVIGLLIGLWKNDDFVQVSYVHIIKRQNNSRQKDRVEIAPEDLSKAAVRAENLAKETGQDLKVVGWFHSHPHISILPSHVDAKTQGEYQLYMDKRFVGLIFSVFDENVVDMTGSIKMIAFQAERKLQSEAWTYKLLNIKTINNEPGRYNGLRSSLKTIVESQQKIVLEEEILHQEYLNRSAGSDQILKRAYVNNVYEKCLILLIENGFLPLYALLNDKKLSIKDTTERLNFLLETLKSQKRNTNIS
jgi:BRCA1/BRCA2-containing complex subunit 3